MSFLFTITDRTKTPATPLYFALKEIPTHEAKAFDEELLALEKACAHIHNEKHLVKLLLAFQHGQRHYLLFEWADGNLAEYWKKSEKAPEHSAVGRQWIAGQCLGLATAVKRIHGLATWQKEQRLLGPKAGAAGGSERAWGRHGDIKPQNILWFSSYGANNDLLVLSDLGLTRYHSSATRSLVPHMHIEGCTWPYRPPEMDLPSQSICQKYDIWSLGCVFLEFCIWWLKGYNAVCAFSEERTEADNPIYGNVEEDKYFVLQPSGTEAKVKPVVLKVRLTDWLAGLGNPMACHISSNALTSP